MQATGDSSESVRPARHGTVVGVLALIISTMALLVWGYTWWRSYESSQYSVAQHDAATALACAAYDTVRTGVATNTNLAAPGGAADVTGSLAVAANARVALIGGGQYVLARIDPATPAELADPLEKFGNKLMDFGAAATAGALNTDPGQTALLRDIDALNGTLEGLCTL
jgi:hypothetical protein